MLDKRLKARFRNRLHSPLCPVCNSPCFSFDADNLEYIKTKRGTEIFLHTKCVKGSDK